MQDRAIHHFVTLVVPCYLGFQYWFPVSKYSSHRKLNIYAKEKKAVEKGGKKKRKKLVTARIELETFEPSGCATEAMAW